MLVTKNGIPLVKFSLFETAGGCVAAVGSRLGGVSAAPFCSLNMSFSVGDAPEAVRENRRRFCVAAGLPAQDIVSCCQVHGTHIEIAGVADRGRGAFGRETAIPETDGLMTAETGVPLTMNFADCTPLLFYDPVRRVCAVSHGGWRGTAGDIAGKTVRRMGERFGSRPADILAGIGPAIGGCSFEVGAEVIATFEKLFSAGEMETLAARKANGKFLFNLPLANRVLLQRAGVKEAHIEDCGLCTYCRDDLFFSYRKSGGVTGRHMGAVMLK